MTKTDESVRLTLKLPEHVLTILDGWAASDLQATPEAVAELDRQLRLNESILRTKVIRPETR